MALPALAKTIAQPMDPSDVVDYAIVLTQGSDGDLLQIGETIYSWGLTLTAEAAAAGLTIKTETGYAPSLTGLMIKFWVEIAAAQQNNPVFAGGVLLGVVLTLNTTSTPARKRQRTVAIKVVEQ